MGNLVSMLSESVRDHGARPLFGTRSADGWSWISYVQFAREIDRLVNALARTDDKPDALIKGIADRQERVREIDGQLRAANAAPKFIEHHLDRIARHARAAIEEMRSTFDNHPEKTRELVGTLFDGKIIFRLIDTPEGPRFELEGTAAPGRLLAVEGMGIPKGASPAGVEPALAT